jgi:hypothetical protein
VKGDKKMDELHEAFVEWAKENGVQMDYKEDWSPWYECWKNGYDQGRADQKAYDMVCQSQREKI